jgi:hypothetical protein
MSKRGSGKPSCPECGKAATGNFCEHCGANLGGRFCNQCGAEIAPKAKFCNQCGEGAAGGAADGGAHRAAAAAAVGGQNLPWWIAGVAMFGLIVVVGTQMVRSGGPSEPAPVQPAGRLGTGAPPDISQMTSIEAADNLYNRIMTAAAEGDSVGARQFMPMGLAAYERARPLDADGLFHLSLLQSTATRLEESLATALQILEANPDHLLGLSAAAEVAAELGRTEEATAHYQHIVDVYDAQMATQLVEYLDHGGITNNLRNVAEAFLAGG